MFFVFQFLASATTNPTVRKPNANSQCGRNGKHAWTSAHRKVFANLFDHGVAVLAFVIAAKARDEKWIAVVASNEEILVVISDYSFLWIQILLSCTEFFINTSYELE